MAKTGRPTDYNLELAQEICDAIRSSSLGLKHLCKANPHWPVRSCIMRWRATIPLFKDMYALAKVDQIEAMVDDIVDISDDDSRDTLITKEGDEKCNGEWIARSRLRVDTRKWLASKLAPRIYGDVIKNASTSEGDDFISKNRDKIQG